jgi:alpha-beta hydrolase superfamily lysophospholipase
MRTDTFTFTDPQNVQIYVHRWLPDNEDAAAYRGVVQLAHGMGEYGARYGRFAEALTAAGYVVYANDHRGHGNTASAENKGYIGKDGFNWMVRDLGQLTDLIREDFPDLPLFLMGHSMGSFMVQKYMYMFPGKVDGIILSATNGRRGIDLTLGHMIANRQAAKRGDHYYSKLMYRLTFGDFNRKFKPNRTTADWLSRDEQEVDAYLNDSFIIHEFTAGFYRDFLQSLKEIHLPENLRIIPNDTPIYVFAGEQDPVGNMGKGIVNLVKLYEELGLTQVKYKLYPGGRHEMLNESNRDEVTQDVIAWLNSQTN